MTSDEVGKNGQLGVYWWLRNRGHAVHLAKAWAPFDLFTDRGTTLEVKTALPMKRSGAIGWDYAIARHGQLCQENCIDFYVLRLEFAGELADLGIVRPLHVVRPAAKILSKHVWISFRSLLTACLAEINADHLIAEADAHKSSVDAARAILLSERNSPLRARLHKRTPPKEEEIAALSQSIQKDRARRASVNTFVEELHQRNLKEAKELLESEEAKA